MVCDGYFIFFLKKIIVKFWLDCNVGGIIFMVVGSFVFEFFILFIGIFIIESDIGIGIIVGFVVFNILFIVVVCGLFFGCVL